MDTIAKVIDITRSDIEFRGHLYQQIEPRVTKSAPCLKFGSTHIVFFFQNVFSVKLCGLEQLEMIFKREPIINRRICMNNFTTMISKVSSINPQRVFLKRLECYLHESFRLSLMILQRL